MDVCLSHRWSDDRSFLVKKRIQKEELKKREAESRLSPPVLLLDDYLAKACFMLTFFVTNSFPSVAYADQMTGLGDIFNTETFVGNTKWLEKFNWVGELVQKCISIFGMLIAIILFMQILLTIIYFVAKPFWDAVDETKKAQKGLLTYSYSVFSNIKGNVNQGSDVIMNYLMLSVPNIKKYSEMGADSANPDWTFSTWLISTFPAKCFLMLIISMTINGTLMQAYMMVVDGMGVVAQRFVDYDSEGLVNSFFNNMTAGYKFAVGTTGVGYDACAGEIAQTMYIQALKKLEDTTTDAKITLGSNIENYVNNELSKDLVQSKVLPKIDASSPLTDEEWENVKVEAVLNNVSSATNAITVSAGKMGLKNAGSGLYIHLYFTLNSRSNSTNYWQLLGND